MKQLLCIAIAGLLLASCNNNDKKASGTNLNALAEKYVRLGLAMRSH